MALAASMGATSALLFASFRSQQYQQQQIQRSQTIDARSSRQDAAAPATANATRDQTTNRSTTLPNSTSAPVNSLLSFVSSSSNQRQFTNCAGCGHKMRDGHALIALGLHWHVYCFKCNQCQVALHGEFVAKKEKAYCEKDYQKLFGVTCVYCKRYITGKVLQAGEAHHFHPSCASCSKCGDPFVAGEEMYLQGGITWHPHCGPSEQASTGAIDELVINSSVSHSQLRASRGRSPSSLSQSKSGSASPFSFVSHQYGSSSPTGYTDSEAVGDLSRVHTISYLNADPPTQGYLRRPMEPSSPKTALFSRPASVQSSDRSRPSSRNLSKERSVPRRMYSVLSAMSRGSGQRARSPGMMNEEAIRLAQYPSGQRPSPDTVPKIERDDFPAPPFPYPDHGGPVDGSTAATMQMSQQQASSQKSTQQRSSRPKTRGIGCVADLDSDTDSDNDPQLKREREELSKIATGLGKVFLHTLEEREKLRAWKRANLDPRNASRTPSATRELPTKLRYNNPTNASPSRDIDRPRPWKEEREVPMAECEQHLPTRTRSSLGSRPSRPPTHSDRPRWRHLLWASSGC